MKKNTNLVYLLMAFTSIMSCFGTEKKNLNLAALKTKSSTDVLFKLPSGFSVSWTTIQLCDAEKTVAKAHYFSCDNVPNNPTSNNYIWDVLGNKKLQENLPLLEMLLKQFGIEINSVAIRKIMNDKTLMDDSPTKAEMFKDIINAFKGANAVTYIEHLEIEPEFQNNGLGQQLASFIFLKIIQSQPQSILCWWSLPLHDLKRKEELYRFYKNFGVTVREDLGGFSWLDARKYTKFLEAWGVKTTKNDGQTISKL